MYGLEYRENLVRQGYDGAAVKEVQRSYCGLCENVPESGCFSLCLNKSMHSSQDHVHQKCTKRNVPWCTAGTKKTL